MGESNAPPSAPPGMMAPPGVMAPPGMMGQRAVGAGAVHPPHEQLLNLPCCIHSNPSWGKNCLLFLQFICVPVCVLRAHTLFLAFYSQKEKEE